jgi:endogenous inhibitor of DNA gyrase (YacG/DUF329 family)
MSKCAICGKPQDPKYRPFCSKRCADVDLNRWLSGGYAIPAAEEDDPDDEAAATTPQASNKGD